MFLTRVALEAGGYFDESLKYVADCDYWMRLGELVKVKKINEVLALETNHGDAKRFADRNELERELRAVRSRYVSPEGMVPFARRAMGRLHEMFWKRVYLVWFLYSLWQRDRRPPWRQWVSILDRQEGIKPIHRQIFRAMFSFLPGASKHMKHSVSIDVDSVWPITGSVEPPNKWESR